MAEERESIYRGENGGRGKMVKLKNCWKRDPTTCRISKRSESVKIEIPKTSLKT